jgi:baseplate J-like protein
MVLTPLVLDDLDWVQLTDAARTRLPALSAGQWTLHAPVDPGITLVELYAWLLDQRVYQLDRVSEPLFRTIVGLLGERMNPVRAARTVMALERDPAHTSIPAGTTFEIARAESGPVFATTDGVELLDVGRIGLVATGGVGAVAIDRGNDLRSGRDVTLFAADGSDGEARIILYLRTPPPASAAHPFSLFLDVAAPDSVHPEWDPEAVNVRPPAEVTWSYSRGPGSVHGRFQKDHVVDGTGGLRRPGLLRLPIVNDWVAEGPPVGGLHPFAIYANTEAATFTAPPRVKRIVPNAVIVEHRRPVQDRRRITEWLPLPGRVIDLDENSAPPIPEETRMRIREVDGSWHRWAAVSDFARSGPTDRVFRVDRARRRIEFGDGLTGRIPRPDPGGGMGPNALVDVMVGAGTGGNVGGGLRLIGTVGDTRGLTLAQAVGGREAETVDEARSRIAGQLKRVERAVTADDHVTLAVGTDGVAIARAHVEIGFHPGFPCSVVPGEVTVFVVPWASRDEDLDPAERVPAPMPDPGALETVRVNLERTRMVGTEVWVCPPRYRTVRLAVRIGGTPDDPTAARDAIDAALRRLLDPLEGGDDRDGWPFGDPIRPSRLMRELVPVVEDAEIESVAIGLDGDPPVEDCEEAGLRPFELPVLTEVVVAFAPDQRSRPGGLR